MAAAMTSKESSRQRKKMCDDSQKDISNESTDPFHNSDRNSDNDY